MQRGGAHLWLECIFLAGCARACTGLREGRSSRGRSPGKPAVSSVISFSRLMPPLVRRHRPVLVSLKATGLGCLVFW